MLQMLEAWGWSYEYIRWILRMQGWNWNEYMYLYGASTEAAQDALQGVNCRQRVSR